MNKINFWSIAAEFGLTYARNMAESFRTSPDLIDLWSRIYLARLVA